ncbi:MAG TPA: hypothetical protein VES61_00065 [Gaiellaceae bacterium]|nr:hypothetical protein [Gaiellaceae bacterium]
MAEHTGVSGDTAGTLAVRARPSPFAGYALSEVVRASVLAGVLAVALVAFGPAGGDAPAHLFRALLIRDGALLWDNLWYGGQYPFSSYSLLYYFPAYVFGNVPVVLVGVVASAGLFASLATREWGDDARWPSRAFAIAACAPVFTGTYSYALALAALLGTLRALQSRRVWLGIGGAGLTVGFSPLAFVFLVLALLAVALTRRRLDRPTFLVAGGLAVAAGIQLLAVSLFPDNGVYPFRVFELLVVLVVGGLGSLLAFRSPRGRAVGAFLAIWAGASVLAFLVASPVGENVTRLRGVVFPLVLLAAVLARFRPRLLAVTALGLALAYTLVPYVAVIPYRTDGRPAEEAFWDPALGYLRANSSADFRVEVVPTGDHWEAYWVPESGLALARGWYRQIDIKENALFYRAPLEAADYRAWLRRMGVRYVLLPATQLGRMGEEREADLLRSGRSGLRPVFRSATGTVYKLPNAVGMLSGPGPASLFTFTSDSLTGRVGEPGVYRLSVRFMPYWRVSAGDICVSRAADGLTLLHAARPGRFALEVDERPLELLRGLVDRGSRACSSG